ncbi:Serine/threonine-protein kinase [Rhypophila decipiens]
MEYGLRLLLYSSYIRFGDSWAQLFRVSLRVGRENPRRQCGRLIRTTKNILETTNDHRHAPARFILTYEATCSSATISAPLVFLTSTVGEDAVRPHYLQMNIWFGVLRTCPHSRRVTLPLRPALTSNHPSITRFLLSARLKSPSASFMTAMSTSAFKYGYIEDVEDLEDYKSGGYHPVQIDDRLGDNQRYRILHKLGHGTFSTAWLAVDDLTSKYVAVKVCIADADPQREIDILAHLSSVTAKDNGSNKHAASGMIPKILDQFSTTGPNGTHSCIVTVPARCSLKDTREASGPGLFQLDVARSLAAQLAMAVEYVHSKGYVHADLHLGNILLQLPSSLNELSVSALYEKFGAPDPQPVILLDSSHTPDKGVPSHVIPPVWLGISSNKLPPQEARLLLSDFGVAFCPSKESRLQSYTPLVIRPPEALFEPTTPLSFPSEIWSLGCVIFELLAHRSLIDGILAPPDEITAQQVELQGRMPDEWWDNWELRDKWFYEDGRPKNAEMNWDWDKRFKEWLQEPRARRNLGTLDEEEKLALLELLKWMLRWRPGERPTAEQVLETAWMRNWAMPAYERSRLAWEQ